MGNIYEIQVEVKMVPTPTPTSINPVSYNVEITPIIIMIALLMVGIIILIVLFRNGWKIKDLKKVKVGEVELERKTDESPELKSGDGINVEVKNSSFHGGVGDIGGVIIKNEKSTDKTSKKKR